MITRKACLPLIMFAILFQMHSVLATEPIMITQSDNMNKVIFDGKWSYMTEWKRSSLDNLSYDDGTLIYLRTAHQGNFIYVFVDVTSETRFNKGSDVATVCIDKQGIRPPTANKDDYCFVVTLDGRQLPSFHF